MNTFASNFNADAISAYIAAKLLMLAEKNLVLYQLCDKANLVHGNGRTFQYTRYERVDLPQDPLSEGVTPSDSDMSISTVQAVMDQWGAVIPVTDVAIDSVKHPVLQQAISRGSIQAKETIDREIFKVMATGTNIYFPNAVSARGSLTSADKISSASIGKVVANLRDDGAIPYEDGMFAGVMDPFAEDDITSDSTFVTAASYGAVKKLYNQEVGSWKGVRWVRTNSYPAIRLDAGGSAASSATAGSLVAATAYDLKLAVVDKKTKHETFITAIIDVTTGGGQTSVDITVPALPSGATAGSKYRLYFGLDGGVLYKAADDIDPSSVYNHGTLPTSGAVAQASPPANVPVHLSFVMGKEAVACPELNKIKAYLTPAGPSDSDPLVQRRKVGWKCDFKPVITNELFLARLEHACTNN